MKQKQQKQQRRKIEKAAAYKSRRILGFGFKQDNKSLFMALGQHFGTPWNGTKPHGYEMAIKLAGAMPLPPMGTTHRAAQAKLVQTASDEFLSSYAWRRLRMEVLIEQGRRCQCCGATPSDGVQIHVDHIKPRKLFPELSLDKTNLQVLCGVCNHGKGNWDQTDWRKPEPVLPPEQYEPMWSKRVN